MKHDEVIKKDLIKKIDEIWDKVLFDSEEKIHCYAIPEEMYMDVCKQIVEVLYTEFSNFYEINKFGFYNDALFSIDGFYGVYSRLALDNMRSKDA